MHKHTLPYCIEFEANRIGRSVIQKTTGIAEAVTILELAKQYVIQRANLELFAVEKQHARAAADVRNSDGAEKEPEPVSAEEVPRETVAQILQDALNQIRKQDAENKRNAA